MPVGTKHLLSTDGLFLYERSSHSWRFFSSFKIDIDFPSYFGVNHGIETGGMQCSDCVSVSGLQNGRDSCHIGWEILTLSPCFCILSILPHFTPKITGKMVEFSDGVFWTWCPDELSISCSKSDVHPSNGLATAHDCYTLTDLLTTRRQQKQNIS
jgi:hypothetical protein